MKNKMLLGIILCLALLFTATPILVGQASTAVIWTDKADYTPGETVTISGSGFNLNAYYDIPVIRPDGSIVLGDGSFTLGWDSTQADAYGNILYSYVLNGITGFYEVRVYLSPWSGDLTQIPIAATTFTDAPAANLDQIRNGPADDPWDPAEWVNGNAGPQNAHYVEGYSVAYRCIMTDLPASTSVTLIIGFDVKHGGRHAIDYLTHYDRISTPSADHDTVFGHPAEEINPVIDYTQFDESADVDTYDIPRPMTDYDYTTGDPVTGMPGNSYDAILAAEGQSALQMSLWGGTLIDVYYVTEGDLSLAQSEAQMAVEFTTSSEGGTAILAWGGHIASRLDWGYDEDGDPRSAGGLTGSPYHMRLLDWTLDNLGQQDRSLKVSAVFVPGTIVVIKDAIPNDAQIFEFTSTTLTPSPFYLDDDGVDDDEFIIFSGLAAGTYDVTEVIPTWWELTDINIYETGTSDSTFSLGTATANIVLNEGETVTVTFTNEGHGKVTVVKDAVPNDPEDFSYTTSLGAAFDLDDDADAALSNTKVFLNVAPGEYTVTEGAETWWTLASIVIAGDDDYTSGDTSTRTGTIYVDPGEEIVVTFTNNGFGKVTVVKDSQPDDAQDFVYSGDLGAFTLDDDGGADSTYSNTKVFDIVFYGQYDVIETLPPGWELLSIGITGDDDYTSGDTSTRTGTIYVDPGEEIVITFVNEKQLEFLKQFTGSGSLDPETYIIPEIIDPKTSQAFQIKTGPQIWWEVTYSVTNKDDEGHFYTLWDKWGGNLLILDAMPTNFVENPGKKAGGVLTLEGGASFDIGYGGYVAYLLANGDISDLASQGEAWMTLHTGDQQEDTNPGKGKGNDKDGNSYDVDIAWKIGWLEPGDTATLTIYLAPGINPGGVLQFSSYNCYTVNTGPRVRVYETDAYADNEFLYSWSWTNQLIIIVEPEL